MNITIPGIDQEVKESKLHLTRDRELIELTVEEGDKKTVISVRADWLKKAVDSL